METKKYALVTGAGRGIGKDIALRLAKDGYSIILNYLSNDQAAQETLEAINALGAEAELLKFDVSDNNAASQALSTWEEAHPGEYISVLVNNAGIRKDALMMRIF